MCELVLFAKLMYFPFYVYKYFDIFRLKYCVNINIVLDSQLNTNLYIRKNAMPKDKYILEFDMKGTPASLLWLYLSTPNGLKQWFAEDVEQNGKLYTFYWNKYPTEAVQVSVRSGERIKFRWVEDDEKVYFEFKITMSELTGKTQLIVTDFADSGEEEGAKALWIKQVKTLKRMLGC